MNHTFINGSTSLVGLIGYPVSHSLSPLIHNTLFRELNLNFVYVPFPVNPRNLSSAICGLKSIGIRGVNVTIPFKERVIPLLDIIDENARLVGAVNTIKVENDKLYGYNTDVSGFSTALKRAEVDVSNKKIILLGAGGAARAVIASAALDGAEEIIILNRTFTNAKKLAEEFKEKLNIIIRPYELSDLSISSEIAEADIIINSTPIGMEGHDDKSPISDELILEHHQVIDLIYSPPQTPLLKSAFQKGCFVLNGMGMLIHQALDSFNIWTGERVVDEKILMLLEELVKKDKVKEGGV